MNNSDNIIAKYECNCACINKLFLDDKEHKYTSFFDLESAIRDLVHPENCEFQIKIKDKLDRQSLIYPNGFHEAPHVVKWRNDSIVYSQKLQESIKPWNHEEIKFYYGAYYYLTKLVELVDLGTVGAPKGKQELNEPGISDKIGKLKSIWLVEPKIKVEEFIQAGNEKNFWNDNLDLTLQRNISTYGTGKTFLGNLFIAFKGWAISEHYDYKEAGKVFCEVFNIKLKETTREPYKAFCVGNRKQISDIKRSFNVR